MSFVFTAHHVLLRPYHPTPTYLINSCGFGTGRTCEEAYHIGQEIADVVTKANPSPVRLQYEKVYSKCVLVSKKRYAGYKLERLDDIQNNKVCSILASE